MSVSVPAGDHVIELEYQPVEVIYGLMGSALGIVRRDTRLDRTDAFLDSWNNQDRAWTDPSPEVRIEPVNFVRTLDRLINSEG